MFHGGPVGVEAVAHTMNTATDTLEDEVEPFLLRGTGRPHAARPPPHTRRLPAPGPGPSGWRQPVEAVLTAPKKTPGASRRGSSARGRA